MTELKALTTSLKHSVISIIALILLTTGPAEAVLASAAPLPARPVASPTEYVLASDDRKIDVVPIDVQPLRRQSDMSEQIDRQLIDKQPIDNQPIDKGVVDGRLFTPVPTEPEQSIDLAPIDGQPIDKTPVR